MTDDRLLFESLDVCLGPRASRFFGAGYKRVGQHLRHIVTDCSTAPGAQANGWASLSYPRDWSRKSTAGDLRPHVSSIDVLVLAASLAEVHLNTAHRLTPDQQRRTWLCSADIRASSRPHEDLADFPVRARLLTVENAEDPGRRPDGNARAPRRGDGAGPAGALRSTYDCRVGGLKARCSLVHEAGESVSAPAAVTTFDSVTDALGPAESRLYGDGYKRHGQLAHRVAVDMAERRVGARQELMLQAGGAGPALHGAEADYAPSVTMVDCLVSVAQLAQVLLYAQDDLDRGSSDTLWMRRVVIEADTPIRPYKGPFDAVAYATRSRLLGLAGDLWRATELAVDDFHGVRGWCSLAHRLPAQSAA